MTLEHNLRSKVTLFCLENGICTRCFSRPIRAKAKRGSIKPRWCDRCRDRATARKLREPNYNRDYYLKHKERKKEYQKRYRAKRKTKTSDIEKAVKGLSNL